MPKPLTLQIEKSLDTGDLLFFDYDCLNCLQPWEVLTCLYQQRTTSGAAQNVAFCMRTPQKLLIVSSHFGGEVQITPYNEFLNKPYIRSVKVRSFLTAPLNLVEATAQFTQQLKEQRQLAGQRDHKDFFSRLLKAKLIRATVLKQVSNNLVPHYLYAVKVLNRNPFQDPRVTVDDLDRARPKCFYDAYELSEAVAIRSYNSQNLAKSNVL